MIFDKDYKMLKALEKGAKSRAELCGGTTTAASRLTRLLELGYIIPNSAGEPEPNKEIKFMLSGEGRAYIQDVEDECRMIRRERIVFSIIVPIALTIITNIIEKIFFT